MNFTQRLLFICVFFIALFYSCVEPAKPKPPPKEIVKIPEQMDPIVRKQIMGLISQAKEHNGKADDTIILAQPEVVASWYEVYEGGRLWSKDKDWLPRADSLYEFIRRCEEYGLFPTDYHWRNIRSVFGKLKDSSGKMDAALWARGELMLSDAFVTMSRHLKLGRIDRDSITLRADTLLNLEFYKNLLTSLLDRNDPRRVLESVEPGNARYTALRSSIPAFLDSLDRTEFTYIVFPKEDTVTFVKQLQARLFESSYITFNTRTTDSIELSLAIKRAQEARGLKVDGIAGPALVGSLNNTGMERLRRIAINLDRFKQMPDTMPATYILVNIPEYRMEVWDSGMLVLQSKIIVGQPKTRTPVLNSEVSNFITFPQWTVPYSIIFKEMLPKIQKNIDFLTKQNLMVVDKNDSVIDPATIDWSKLNKKYFPYLIRQRQGDDNSLGVMKFNFRNKYDVYMHDTNARSMFSRPVRALSHGCVRVQKWDSLSHFLISKEPVHISIDTLSAWLKRQEKHIVSLRQKTPVFIRYFTCQAGEDGRIIFFDDIYGDDKVLRERYFAKK